MPNHDHTVGWANSSGSRRLSVPITSTPTSSKQIATQATRVPAAGAREDQRERGEDVDESRDAADSVYASGASSKRCDDLDEGAAGGGERHDRVDDHEHAADAGHAGAGGRRHDRQSKPYAARAQATWIVQIACMRHTMTATASAAMPMMTVLHRLRSSSAQATAAGGSSAAETR